MIKLDIVIPLYNSQAIMPNLITRLNQWNDSIDFNFRVIFVDDGSTEDCSSLIKNCRKKFPYSLIRLNKNYGQHSATAIGLGFCEAPLIATLDDDLQHDPFEITKLINELERSNADIVFASFENKKHNFIRNIGSKLLKFILQLEGVDYSAITSFRLMRKKVASPFKLKRKPIIFLEEYLLNNASSISTCKIAHHNRVEGKSGYTSWNLLKFALKIILFHSSLPLKLIIRLGLITSIVCFFIGCYFIYQKLIYDSHVGYSSIIVSIFFSSGLILMTLGIIGEYIRRIWISQHELDQIIIAED